MIRRSIDGMLAWVCLAWICTSCVSKAPAAPPNPVLDAQIASLVDLANKVDGAVAAGDQLTAGKWAKEGIELAARPELRTHPAALHVREIAGILLSLVPTDGGLGWNLMAPAQRSLPVQEDYLRRQESMFGPAHPLVADTLRHTAESHAKSCELDAARVPLFRALSILQAKLPLTEVSYAKALHARGSLYNLLRDEAAASQDVVAAITVLSKNETDHHAELLNAYLTLAVSYHDLKRPSDQRSVLEQAIELASRWPDSANSSVLSLAVEYAEVADPEASSRADARLGITRWFVGEAMDPSVGETKPGTLDSSPPSPRCQKDSTPPKESVANADVVVRQMRPGFRACYQQTLAIKADANGSARVTTQIGAEGQVRNVRGVGRGLLAQTYECLTQRVMVSRFSPPLGGSAKIVIPITFALETR